MSRSSNTPATPVSNPASAQGVEPIGFMRPEDNDGGSFWCSRSKNGYYTEAVYLSPAPSRDAAVPASGGVEASSGCYDKDGNELFVGDRVRYRNECSHTKREYWNPEYEIVFEAPCFTLKHVGGGKDGGSHLFILKHGGSNGYLELVMRSPALAKPASEPADGGVRKYVPHDTFERIVREAADEIAGGQSVRDVLRGAITLALSSAPATPSPAEAEALPAGVDVHEEWQRRLKRNDFSDDDWSEWKACDERQVRDIQTLGHPSGFPFLNAEVRRVRITTAALSASAPAPEDGS